MPAELSINNEADKLKIINWKNGIKLEKNKKRIQKCNSSTLNPYSVQTVLDLPFNVYFLSKKSEILGTNQSVVDLFKRGPVDSFLGKTVFDIADEKCCHAAIYNDKKVMETNKKKIVEEDILFDDGITYYQCLTIKLPWYNLDNQIVGVFGCSIVYGVHDLAASLSIVSQLGLLHPIFTTDNNTMGRQIGNVFLTKREIECVTLCIRGKTATEIASILGLSKRTVESYMENIKNKLNVSSRNELISKTIDYFYSSKDVTLLSL